MNDNELIAWQVESRDGSIEHICLNKSTAEYLRDWCMALDHKRFRAAIERNPEVKVVFEKAMQRVDYHVVECEVIVG